MMDIIEFGGKVIQSQLVIGAGIATLFLVAFVIGKYIFKLK